MLTENDLAEDDLDTLYFNPVFYFNNSLNELNTCQQQVKSSRYPLVAEGPPGSGKTFITAMLLSKEVESFFHAPDPRRILCIAEEARLVDEIKNNWQQQPNHHLIPPLYL